MKKRLLILLLSFSTLVLLCVLGFSAAAEVSENTVDAVQNDAKADLADTGITYANLGQSFYARISLDDPELYFTIPDDPMHRTTALKPYVENGTQYWHFTRQTDGSYRIRNVSKNMYLEVYNTHVKENDDIFHSEENNPADQRWILQKAGSGYQIITCCDTTFMMKAVNLYGNTPEVILSQDSFRETTHFTITKLPLTSDYLQTPEVKLTVINGGITVTWNQVPMASMYCLYRYNDSTKKWVALKKSADTNYTDTNVVSGKTYQYIVKCVAPLASKYTPKSVMYLSQPVPKVTNNNGGPVISWPKITGAQAYRVFYKTTGSWAKLADTTANSYTHAKAAYNVTYYYTVRCISRDGKQYTSAYNTKGISNKIVKTPTVSVTLNPNGYQLNWAAIPGAARYKVMIKSKATNWTWSKTIDCNYNNYFYGEPISNNGYYFTVRCLDAKNQYISGYKSTAMYTYYAAPRVTKFVSSKTATALTWGKVAGAAKYRVFRWDGKKFVKCLDTTALTAKIPVTGSAKQNACFAIRCMDKNGKLISSYYETILSGKTILSYHPGGYSSKHKF